MKTTGRFGVYLLVLVGLLGCGAAGAQTKGAIRGIVNDPSGAVVPGATVSVTLAGTDYHALRHFRQRRVHSIFRN